MSQLNYGFKGANTENGTETGRIDLLYIMCFQTAVGMGTVVLGIARMAY